MSAISEEEIEREVRTLKNLRRRSGSAAGPGDLALDPDLPPSDAFSSSASASSSSGTSPTYSSNDDVTLSLPTGGGDGLFWVPAHLHPELAPGEFRAFLKQHTHGDPMAVDVAGESGEASLGRSPSWLARSSSLSGGLGRKKSMLSRQYNPRAGDLIENERPPALMRRGSSVYGRRNNEQEPTLEDLQKLEELVEGSGIGDDPEQMGALLRRTLSRNISPSMADDGILSPGEDTTAPLVVPRPGSIIRRTARTKIRKTAPGEVPRRGFGSGTRRGRATPSEEGGRPSTEERRSDETTSEGPSSESRHMSGESYQDKGKQVDPSALSDDSTDEALIFDAYAGDRTSMSTTSSVSSYGGRSRSPSPDDHDTPLNEKALPILAPIHAPKASDANWFEDEDQDLTPTQESPMSAALHAMTLLPTSGPSDDIFQATPQQQAAGTPSRQPVAYPSSQTQAPPPAPPKRTANEQYLPPGSAPPHQSSAGGMPAGMSDNMAAPQRNGVAPPSLVIQQPPLSRIDSGASATSTMSSKEKEKAKKGGLFSKKDKKDKDKEKSKKEKDGFLGSLFGSKKKQEEAVSVSNFATAGPAAAAALLGTSKSAKSLQHSGTSSPTSPGFSNFARYPIHVERAVYRLSHIKLANARRPLIEQVLISNLMFWYLGVIGRTAGPSEDKKKGTTNGLEQDRAAVQNTPPPKGTPAKPADTGSAGVKQPDASSPPPSPGRAKGGLNKPERSRQPNSHPEAAYRAPQYGMQNAQMDKEMRGGGGNGGSGNGGGGGVSPVREKTSPTSPQHHGPPQPYPSQPAQQQPQQQPRTSSIPASPARTRSPPVSPALRQEYPPGIAPPRAPPTSSFGSPARPLAPSGGGDGRESRGDSSRQQRYSANYGLPSGAAPHPHHHSTSPPPGMRQPPPQQHYAPMQNGSPRQEAQRLHPQHSGGSRPSPGGGAGRSSPTAGPQPGQIFQYPGQQYSGQQQRSGGGGPQPGQIFNAQPGQIFHHPQFQQQPQQGQRPGPPQPNWESPQRLPQQQHPGPALAQAPPRRSSSNSGHGHDPYRANPGYQPGGQTSPTHQSFYGGGGPGGTGAGRPPSMQPGQQYGYAPAGGQLRQQTVSPVQYPHHR